MNAREGTVQRWKRRACNILGVVVPPGYAPLTTTPASCPYDCFDTNCRYKQKKFRLDTYIHCRTKQAAQPFHPKRMSCKSCRRCRRTTTGYTVIPKVNWSAKACISGTMLSQYFWYNAVTVFLVQCCHTTRCKNHFSS